jgi:hypothetical protein
MSSNSETELNEKFLDEWLTGQGFPTSVPLQMKLLTYGGHVWVQQRDLEAKTAKKGRGRPPKEFSDYVRRADVYRSVEQSLQQRGYKDLTKTEIINVCLQIVKILHEHGEVSDEELSLWTRVNTIKSILDHLPEGFAELEALSRK